MLSSICYKINFSVLFAIRYPRHVERTICYCFTTCYLLFSTHYMQFAICYLLSALYNAFLRHYCYLLHQWIPIY